MTLADRTTFSARAQEYLSNLIDSLYQRFPQPRLLSLSGVRDPRNVSSSNSVMELASPFGIDPLKLWSEFQSY